MKHVSKRQVQQLEDEKETFLQLAALANDIRFAELCLLREYPFSGAYASLLGFDIVFEEVGGEPKVRFAIPEGYKEHDHEILRRRDELRKAVMLIMRDHRRDAQ